MTTSAGGGSSGRHGEPEPPAPSRGPATYGRPVVDPDATALLPALRDAAPTSPRPQALQPQQARALPSAPASAAAGPVPVPPAPAAPIPVSPATVSPAPIPVSPAPIPVSPAPVSPAPVSPVRGPVPASPAPGVDPDATTVIPKLPGGGDPDATATIPIPPGLGTTSADAAASAAAAKRKSARDRSRELRNHRRPSERPSSGDARALADEDAVQPSMTLSGEIVVPLRAVRTDSGYRSVYSDMTRPSILTIARTTLRTLGEVMITLGLVVLLFAAYEVWGVGAKVDAHQGDLTNQLADQWQGESTPSAPASGSAPAPPPPDGSPIAKLYIPRIKSKAWVVVQGTSEADIRYAPGHYPTTAMPGEIGNFSVAGHRTPAIFWDLDKLRQGDQIVVETKDNWYVYHVTQSHVVVPSAVTVIAPVPNQPDVEPTEAMLTITTCNPKYNNYQRLVVHAQLAETLQHDAGPPAGLAA